MSTYARPAGLDEALRLLSQDGVHTVSYASWFGGIYQDPRNFFANFGVDAETYLALYPEMVVSDAHREAFMADRTGALVGVRLMERFGWTVGQTITLQGTIYPGEHRFTIRGVYEAGRRGFDESSLRLVLRCHLETLEHRQDTTHELHSAINRKFREAKLSIPFPQRDLHFKTPMTMHSEGNGSANGRGDEVVPERRA